MLVAGLWAKPAEEPLGEAESLRLRVARLARIWSRFGFFLPPRSKKLLQYDLAEHAADFYEALATTQARQEQHRLTVRFTVRAVAKVLDCTRVALRSRLQEEFRWVASRLPRD
jgi:hypothetical protein